MKFVYSAASIAVALLVASAAPSQVRPAAAPTRAEQLDILADFFVPKAVLFAISREMCDTAFRTDLAADPELPVAEQALPGLIDRMVKTSSALCDVEIRKVIDTRQDQVRIEMAKQMPPADLGRVSRLLASSVQQARAFKVDARPGYTMKQIVAQIATTAAQDRQLRLAQIAFARTPGGIALIDRVHDYQVRMRPLLDEDQATYAEIATRSFKLAHREANLYAQEKGMLELYADAPIPPLPASQLAATATPGTPVTAKLAGSFVYIYSFLDVREDEYTPRVLDQFDTDLTARLNAVHVASKILRFNQSSRGKDEFFAKKVAEGTESRSVPVAETIQRNLADERTAGARYRLIIFPDNFTVSGAWRFYDIRFMLMDAVSGRSILDYTYSGKHMVMLKNSENAEARSKKILDHAFEEIKARGLL